MKIPIILLFGGLLFPIQAFAQETTSSAQSFIEEGDRHWNLRAESAAQSSGPTSIRLDQAVNAYRQALDLEPDSPAPRWRLMRALFFKGEYLTEDQSEKKKIFDEGKAVGEEALRLIRAEASKRTGQSMDWAGPVDLAPVMKDSPDTIATFLWSSANWGEWALAYGKFQAVRQGAATKIRDLATAVTLMDPNFAEGGGYRVLGRLHHQTPYVPFITGWASNRKAVEFLRQAYQTGPRNSLNRLYLAEALWDEDADLRKEAIKIAQDLVNDAPRPEFLVEDLKTQEQARLLLVQWKKNY
jgi:tetratricopeptide (TPR) repeat protein